MFLYFRWVKICYPQLTMHRVSIFEMRKWTHNSKSISSKIASFMCLRSGNGFYLVSSHKLDHFLIWFSDIFLNEMQWNSIVEAKQNSKLRIQTSLLSEFRVSKANENNWNISISRQIHSFSHCRRWIQFVFSVTITMVHRPFGSTYSPFFFVCNFDSNSIAWFRFISIFYFSTSEWCKSNL